MNKDLKKILLKLAVFVIVLIMVNSFTHYYFLPFTWGDEHLHTKYEYYKDHKNDYNTVFLGGSLCFRHINPHIVDSIAGSRGLDTRSFNLGGDAIAYLKQHRILEDMLKDPSPDLEYVFLSLSSTTRFKYMNLHTKRFATWQRPKDSFRAIRATWELPISLKQRAKFTYYYLLTMVENGFNVGFMTNAAQFLSEPDKYYDEACLGIKKDGFYPYDHQEMMEISPGHKDYHLYQMLVKSKEAYQLQVAKRDSLRARDIEEFSDYDNDLVLHSILNDYLRIIKKCEEKGIRVIVLMPPRTREPYKFLLPVYNRLPEANKINLASPIDYPEFYAPENSYNFHHLNLRGANIFSTELADKITSLLHASPSDKEQ